MVSMLDVARGASSCQLFRGLQFARDERRFEEAEMFMWWKVF